MQRSGETSDAPATLSTQEAGYRAFGEGYSPSLLDRIGIGLSGYQVRKRVGGFEQKAIGDFGCGYGATFTRSVLGAVDRAVLVDVALAPDLKEHERVQAIEGELPAALSKVDGATLDLILLLSVLEHLWDPQTTLQECRRILRPGGVLLVNVPAWRAKPLLEFAAFRLNLTPRDQIDDHKTYYDVDDLWPILVKAGFVPHNIRCFRHKFGLNTFAVCRIDP